MEIVFDSSNISIEQVAQIANRKVTVRLGTNPEFVKRINAGPKLVQKLIDCGVTIYGVTTGFGDSCTTQVGKDALYQLQVNAVVHHGVALGAFFSPEETRAIITARLVSLARGFSGVRLELLEQLVKLLEFDVLPRIPQEGSVGASGDLSTLSYVGAVLCGQRNVLFQGEIMPANEALAKVGMTPIRLIAKEGLAIVNGTSGMTGVACLAWLRASRLSRLVTRISSLAVVALAGNKFHYDKILFSIKPHAGQQLVAGRIRSDLNITDSSSNENHNNAYQTRVNDRYSLRCSPHIIGVLEDILPLLRLTIENELNSTNDNPIIDTESGRVFHGGHFYGGHIAMAMDTLKCQVANLADLMDRQLALLVDPKFNDGLPANLTGAEGAAASVCHGLKGVQICTSGWTAEALKHTMPASVFSRSTECHNQDKVSMGTIAARDCQRVLDLTEQVASGLLISLRQALELRSKVSNKNGKQFDLSKELSEDAQEFVARLNQEIEFLQEDKYLEPTLRKVLQGVKDGKWDCFNGIANGSL